MVLSVYMDGKEVPAEDWVFTPASGSTGGGMLTFTDPIPAGRTITITDGSVDQVAVDDSIIDRVVREHLGLDG